ncbi:MAG TPA: DUF6443 domain-containing protein, partial [Chitinophagaceae bacterium]
MIRTTAIISLVMASSIALSQTNKPVVATQVPAAAHVAATPGAYNAGAGINYVRSREAMGPITDGGSFNAAGYTDVKEATQYMDGLGRPLQTVMRQATPGSSPSDVVMPVVYDAFGRETYKYLPYVHSSSDGAFKTNPFSAQNTFYQGVYPNEQPAFTGEQVYYGQVNYESSPLNRPLKSLAPGNSWAGNGTGVEQQYLVNTAADTVRVWDIGNSALTYSGNDITTNIPVSGSAYAAGQLYKNVTKDEQGNAIVEYKDKQGKVLLKKAQAGAVATDFSGYSGFLSTFYIYDDFERLRFVIPPKAVTALLSNGWNLGADTSLTSELCFRYEYDGRGRMIAKKVPGAEWVYMVYDNRDRLVFTQDGFMRRTMYSGHYLATVYDPLDRPVMTGFCDPFFSGRDAGPSNPGNLQQIVTKYSNEDTSTQVVTNQPPPDDLYVAVRHKNDNDTYQAIKSVTFTNEFSPGDLPEFHTELVTFYDWVVSRTNVSGNLMVNGSPIADTLIAGYPVALEWEYTTIEALTITHYDDYDWTTQGFTDRYNSKLAAGNNLHAETPPAAAQQNLVSTRGMVTGSETRILPPFNPNEISSFRILYSIPYYDDRGRVIQTQSNNYRNGVDIQTNLYDFTGKVLSNYLVHTNLDAGMLNLRVRTDMEYDVAGRLLKTWKTINDDDTKKALIAENAYDALGKLKQKKLGQKRNPDSTYSSAPLETLDYSYNIRGWLKGINKDYANNDNSQGNNNHWFGMELSYDYGFQANQLNGNISGIKWRSAGDGAQRAYGFGYDALNRLMYGDFNQLFSSSWQKQDPNSALLIDFSTRMGDGINPASAYDENGNILAMKQWGLKLMSSDLIDDLTYHYAYNGSAHTNKLLNVADAKSDTATKLGDFHYSAIYTNALNGAKPATAVDYIYDANGNLTQDLNKNIYGGTYNGILYNYLNLPIYIPMAAGTIDYIYDAAGNKLSKEVTENNHNVPHPKITDYIGPMVYQDSVLQFISDEEGRIRYKPASGAIPASFAYDYFIKDHLGNVRMVLTDELQTDAYPAATMEAANATNENALYSKIEETRTDIVASVPGYPTDNYITPNNSVAKVNGSVGGNKIGPGITLRVMSGDNFSIRVSSWYKTNGASPATPAPNPLPDLIAALASGIGGLPNAHGTMADLQDGTLLTPGLTNFFTSRDDSTNGSRPKA